MRPLLHASLINGRSGDPVLWIETLFERRAILFDLGDIAALPPRKIHRLEHVFVSHTHIDHFIGFDQMLRVLVGRDKTINLYGPAGIVTQVERKLTAYCWNLVGSYACDLVFRVSEIVSLREQHPKLRDMRPELLASYLHPPSDPSACVFARSTTCLSADLERVITPCQFGGDPDCASCGCMATAALDAVGRYRLGGVVPVSSVLAASLAFGRGMQGLRRTR